MTCFARFTTDRTSCAWIGGVLALVVLLVALPASVHGQSSVQSLLEKGETAGANVDLMRTVASRAESAGLDPQATADLLRPAVTLASRDLPSTPLLNKTLEGLAKRVPASRMTPVLQTLQTHTEDAGALVSTWMQKKGTQQVLESSDASSKASRDRLITSIAEAQQQDLPLQHVEQFLNTLPEAVQRRPVSLGNVATAVSVMPDLPGARKNPKTSRALLSAALDAGYDAESLRQLPAALEQAQRTSQRPASVIAEGAAQAIAKGTPPATVLQNLFQGSVPGNAPADVGNAPSSTPPSQGRTPGQNGRPTGGDERPGPPEDRGNAPSAPDVSPGGAPSPPSGNG